jgi:hypothetical protein
LSLFWLADSQTPAPRTIPTFLPIVEAYSTHCVDVGRSPNFVVAENARAKENSNSFSSIPSRLKSKKIQHSFKFGR